MINKLLAIEIALLLFCIPAGYLIEGLRSAWPDNDSTRGTIFSHLHAFKFALLFFLAAHAMFLVIALLIMLYNS